jgi:hypothetical protein
MPYHSLWKSEQYRQMGADLKLRLRKAMVKRKELLFKASAFEVGVITNPPDRGAELPATLYLTGNRESALAVALQIDEMGLSCKCRRDINRLVLTEGVQEKLELAITRLKEKVGFLTLRIFFPENPEEP